jgi:enoyl-CoA hydratase/carnithine racemase
LRATKALIRRATREAVLETIAVEGETFANQIRTPEAMEAFQAFMARRAADFSRF